jgi:hypothetical protein
MKLTISLAAVLSLAVASVGAPKLAGAQEYHAYGSHDPCSQAKGHAATNGTVTGGLLGAVVGGAVAGGGSGSRLGGALIGGTVGAVAGHEIGKNSVRCVSYPPHHQPHKNCHWVQQYYDGRNHDFEVCRDADGVWRPSGRS